MRYLRQTRPILTLCSGPFGNGLTDLTSSRMIESSSTRIGSSSMKLSRHSSRICCAWCGSMTPRTTGWVDRWVIRIIAQICGFNQNRKLICARPRFMNLIGRDRRSPGSDVINGSGRGTRNMRPQGTLWRIGVDSDAAPKYFRRNTERKRGRGNRSTNTRIASHPLKTRISMNRIAGCASG